MTSRRLAVIGALLGVGFGIWNLLSSLLDPFAEDTIPALLVFYGPMFASWGAAAFFAARTSGRVADGIRAGAIVAFVTFVVFDVMVILRVNIFLHDLTGRLDWQNLMTRFHESGSGSFRTFINYHYVTGAPFKILVATAIGAVTGVIGGLFGAPIGTQPLLLTQAILAFLILPGTVAFFVPLCLLAPGPDAFVDASALIPLMAGIGLLLWCVREFYVAGRGTLAPWAPPQELVETGPYRFSRNPMYIAVLMLLWGWALGFRSWRLTIYAVAVMFAFHLRVVLYEEPRLARTFGEKWRLYRAHVPRWFGEGIFRPSHLLIS